METNNETVEQVCECVEYLAGTDGGGLEIFGEHINPISLADRILAAHKRKIESYKRLLMTSQCALEDEIVKNQGHRREIAELRECLEQAYGDKIGTYTMKGIEVEKWRKALEGEING